MHWKPVLLRLFLEFLLDKLPELITIILDDLGGNPGHDHKDDQKEEGKQ